MITAKDIANRLDIIRWSRYYCITNPYHRLRIIKRIYGGFVACDDNEVDELDYARQLYMIMPSIIDLIVVAARKRGAKFGRSVIRSLEKLEVLL